MPLAFQSKHAYICGLTKTAGRAFWQSRSESSSDGSRTFSPPIGNDRNPAPSDEVVTPKRCLKAASGKSGTGSATNLQAALAWIPRSQGRGLKIFQQDRLESNRHHVIRRDSVPVTCQVTVVGEFAGSGVGPAPIRVPHWSCLITTATGQVAGI
jgi:hypothetical protein